RTRCRPSRRRWRWASPHSNSTPCSAAAVSRRPGWVASPPDWAQTSVPQAIRRADGAVWSPYYPDLSEADLQEARRRGLRVVVWTVNEPADMAALIDLGVDGLITDYPDRARAAMVRRGLALPPAFSAE